MGQADCCCCCCISVANDDDEDVDNRCSAVSLGPLLSKLRRPCPGGDSTEAAVLTTRFSTLHSSARSFRHRCLAATNNSTAPGDIAAATDSLVILFCD